MKVIVEVDNLVVKRCQRGQLPTNQFQDRTLFTQLTDSSDCCRLRVVQNYYLSQHHDKHDVLKTHEMKKIEEVQVKSISYGRKDMVSVVSVVNKLSKQKCFSFYT